MLGCLAVANNRRDPEAIASDQVWTCVIRGRLGAAMNAALEMGGALQATESTSQVQRTPYGSIKRANPGRAEIRTWIGCP